MTRTKTRPGPDTRALRLMGLVMILLLGGPAVASAQKAICPPEVIRPAHGAERVSLTPDIVTGFENTDNCSMFKHDRVFLYIHETPARPPTNLWSDTIELSSSRVYSTEAGEYDRIVVVDTKVPEGHLEPNTEYRLRLFYDNQPGLIPPLNRKAASRATGATFTTGPGDGPAELEIGEQNDTHQLEDADPDHTIIISGQDTRGGTDYTLRGGGELNQIEGTLMGMQLTKQDDDNVSGSTATGHVAGGVDGFEVFGKLPSILIDQPGNVEVFVDGNPFHSIVITSEGIPGETDYTIEGGGQLEQVDGTLAGMTVSKQDNDEVDGTRATGHVAGAADGFIVTGPLPNITLSSPANAKVYIDGKLRQSPESN